ncbi:protein-tyrosine phosphatase-like protein [Mycena amicta]|nr:protein-tyrosine phosphatase-like protein [Mycena amicta]
MPSTDDSEISRILSSAPFLLIDGVVNLRSIGGYSCDSGGVHPTLLLRSGELSYITPAGKEQLRALGVRRVFDLRSDFELKNFSGLTTIDGVEVVRAPMGGKDGVNGWDQSNIEQRLRDFQERERETFVKSAQESLEWDAAAIGTVFRSFVEHPGEGCLFHCTAGKDRTGIVAALILMLLGVNDDDIAQDYALTTLGLEPARTILQARLQKIPACVANMEGTMNMGSSKKESMRAILDMIREEYGGAAEYLRNKVGLTEEDVQTVRKNLVVVV